MKRRRLWAAGWPLLLGLAGPAAGQTALPNTITNNPQAGATPRPPAPVITTPAAPAPVTSTAPASPPPLQVAPVTAPIAGPAIGTPLPEPSRDPLHLDLVNDPVLRLPSMPGDAAAFRQFVAGAVTRSPLLDESVAQADEARGARNEARAREYPTIDASLSYFNIVSRAFSNDPLNILERSRPRERTDGTVNVQQQLYDFGATGARIRAGNARLAAGVAGIDDTASQLALRAVAAWYNVFGYRALIGLGDAFVADQLILRGQLQQRVTQGYAASGDMAQVDSAVAATQAQVAEYRRQLATAEAQYTQLAGAAPPALLPRAPRAPIVIVSADAARARARALPSVKAADLLAQAARLEEKGTRADMLPRLTAGVDAGRYGVIETDRDYDVRASATLSFRLFGGAPQRLQQASARARGAEARFADTRESAERDAAVAWTDVQALQQSEAAIRDNYVAARQSRDVLAERFRVSRGTLFDVMNAEVNYFNTASRYVQTLIELDTAGYVLLARTGRLLQEVGVATPQQRP